DRFFFQADDGIRYFHVTGVQTCALPICAGLALLLRVAVEPVAHPRPVLGLFLRVGEVHGVLRFQATCLGAFCVSSSETRRSFQSRSLPRLRASSWARR